MPGSKGKWILSSSVALVLLTGCASPEPWLTGRSANQSRAVGGDSGLPPWDNISYWNGEGLNGPAHVKIDLGVQLAYFYKGRKLAGVSTVSTGREGYNTPRGTFPITQKDPAHRSNLYGDYVDSNGNVVVRNVDVNKDPAPPGTRFLGAPMPNFMRFKSGIGMHAGYLPGYPASHGCVRLPPKMAQHFFDNVSIGTPVTVVN